MVLMMHRTWDTNGQPVINTGFIIWTRLKTIIFRMPQNVTIVCRYMPVIQQIQSGHRNGEPTPITDIKIGSLCWLYCCCFYIKKSPEVERNSIDSIVVNARMTILRNIYWDMYSISVWLAAWSLVRHVLGIYGLHMWMRYLCINIYWLMSYRSKFKVW